ncbi:WhiB family transcriptional regulator [Streptomyces sp. NPDC001719]
MPGLISGTRPSRQHRRPGELGFEPALDPGLSEAVCASVAPEVFFPAEGNEVLVALAQRLCCQCPVKAACQALALEKEGSARPYMRFGIWGGTTPSERYALYRHKRRGTAPVTRPGVCGSCRGYTRHRRRGENPCDACLSAVAADSRRRRRAARSAKGAA